MTEGPKINFGFTETLLPSFQGFQNCFHSKRFPHPISVFPRPCPPPLFCLDGVSSDLLLLLLPVTPVFPLRAFLIRPTTLGLGSTVPKGPKYDKPFFRISIRPFCQIHIEKVPTNKTKTSCYLFSFFFLSLLFLSFSFFFSPSLSFLSPFTPSFLPFFPLSLFLRLSTYGTVLFLYFQT